MSKKNVLFLFIFMFIITIVFIHYTGKEKYSPPTISEVNEFVSKNSINALSIKETNEFTIVLFENVQEYGHYILYKNQKNKLYSGCVKAGRDSKENTVSLGGVASGKIPFVTVIINDEDMLQKAKKIEITFKDGTVVNEMISGKGTIVLHHNEINKEPMSYIKLIIYDKDMTKLYEQ